MDSSRLTWVSVGSLLWSIFLGVVGFGVVAPLRAEVDATAQWERNMIEAKLNWHSMWGLQAARTSGQKYPPWLWWENKRVGE